MKAIVTFAAVMCFMTLPAFGADGQLSQSSLSRLGLAGLTPISDDQGLEIRGTGLMQAMGMDNGYGDNQNKNDMHDRDKDKDRDHNKDKDRNKHHEKKEHEKHHEHKNHDHNQMHNHEHQAKCDFGAKCHINFGSLCSHIHTGKG